MRVIVVYPETAPNGDQGTPIPSGVNAARVVFYGSDVCRGDRFDGDPVSPSRQLADMAVQAPLDVVDPTA